MAGGAKATAGNEILLNKFYGYNGSFTVAGDLSYSTPTALQVVRNIAEQGGVDLFHVNNFLRPVPDLDAWARLFKGVDSYSVSGTLGAALLGGTVDLVYHKQENTLEYKVNVEGAGVGVGSEGTYNFNTGKLVETKGFAGAMVIVGAKGEFLGLSIGREHTGRIGVFFKNGIMGTGASIEVSQGVILGEVTQDFEVVYNGDSETVVQVSDESVVEKLLSKVKGDHCFAAGTLIDMWDGSRKPIEEISPNDWVISYDKAGALRPGRVSDVKVNQVRHILDFHGVMVTPGHVMLCGDGPFSGQHAPLIDILRSDSALIRRDGTAVRAATNCPVGSAEDGFVWAVTGARTKSGGIRVRDKGRLRLGARVVTRDGADVSIAELIAEAGGEVTADGLVLRSDAAEPAAPFLWSFSDMLPQPEDYVLQRSGLTLVEIYSAGEWEGEGPMLAAPRGLRKGVMSLN